MNPLPYNAQLIFQGPRYSRVISLLASGSPMIFSSFASQRIFLPGEHRDETKVAGNRRVMPDFNRRDGALASPDAVQEVLLVIG